MDSGIKRERGESVNEIKRDIYVLKNRLKEPIELTQGTDSVRIKFYMRDYTLESGTTALVYVEKPSGKGIQSVGEVNALEGIVLIKISKQMTAEAGKSKMQIQLTKGDEELYTFEQQLWISKSLIRINSENGSSFFDEYLSTIANATDAANKAASEANKAKNELKTAADEGRFSATIDVGKTETIDSDRPAIVTNRGTTKDAIMDFQIPRGKQGETGPQGAQGDKGDTGPIGPQGAKGDRGDSGILTKLESGWFTLYVNEKGELILVYNDVDDEPPFKIRNGNLMYVIQG